MIPKFDPITPIYEKNLTEALPLTKKDMRKIPKIETGRDLDLNTRLDRIETSLM